MKRVLRKAVELASPLLYEKFFFGSRGASWAGRKCAVSITFDVEYARDAKALKRTAELLDSYSVKGSFACIGKLVEQFPREHALIADEGHEIMNHTYSHPNHDVLNPAEFFNRLPREKQEWEIAEFEKTSRKILGVKPVGFRAPHFGDLNSQSAYEILEKRGYAYSSSTVLTKTKAKGLPFNPSRKNFLKPGFGKNAFELAELPVMTCPKHYYSVFDSFHCFRTSPPAHAREGEFHGLFSKTLEMALAHGFPAVYYFDPSDVAGKKDFEKSLETLSSKKKDAWIATCGQIANELRTK
ncbi:MAG TPA: polysaccharide deacetylase family protein [Candidatus Norongarragalinales archaeon]|nr:polysaccharide deacetylase family protein [Candidatus Norongarragalinales archaeon]